MQQPSKTKREKYKLCSLAARLSLWPEQVSVKRPLSSQVDALQRFLPLTARNRNQLDKARKALLHPISRKNRHLEGKRGSRLTSHKSK